MGPRGYYRYPWPPAALERLRELACGRSIRATGRELRARRLVRETVAPGTIWRALRRARATSP